MIKNKYIKMKKRLEKFMFVTLLFALMFSGTFALTTELVNTNPSPVLAGDYADITVRFLNEAIGINSELNDVSFEIEKTDFILPVSSDSDKISQILGGEQVTRTFRVFFSDDLKQGSIDVPLIIKYDGISTKSKIKVFVEEGLTKPEIYLGQIKTIPSEILQDSKNNKLIVNLQNLGDKTAELVKVELVVGDEIESSYSYSFEDSLSSIDGGSEAEVEFTIDVVEGIQESVPAKLLIRYRAKNSIGSSYNTYVEEINFDIKITPAPYLIIESVEPLSDMKIGSTEQKLKVTVRNNGTEDAEEVRLRVIPDISYPFIFEETTEYVGAKIKVGESADVIFKLEVTSSADIREYLSKVVIETLVEDTRYSREDIISITPVKGNKIEVSFFAYLIVVVILVISVIIGFNTYVVDKKFKK